MLDDFYKWMTEEKNLLSLIIANMVSLAAGDFIRSINKNAFRPIFNKAMKEEENINVKYIEIAASCVLMITNLIFAYVIAKVLMKRINKKSKV